MKEKLTTRFIFGRAGSGKTQFILDRVDEMLRDDPLGAPIFVIVPDQATLLYERMIACRREDMVTTRLRVMGFGQFGRHVLSCVGGAAVPEVTALGRQLIITRLLLQSSDELLHYRQSVTQPGLPDVIDRLFSEFEETGKSLDDLDQLIVQLHDADPTSTLVTKLRDLRLLYPKYHDALGAERLDQHLRQRQICDAIHNCPELDGAYLAVDAFDDLRPSECKLLACCAARGMRMDVALLIDPGDKQATMPESKIDENDPFRRPRRTFKRLVSHLKDAGVGFAIEELKTRRRFNSNSIAAIEANFLAGKPVKIELDDSVRFFEAPSREAEIDHAARFIREKIAGGMRYREIAVIVRSIADYGDAIETSFRAHAIPHFIDRVRSATHHPLIQLVLSMLRPALASWKSRSVIDLLKTELTSTDRTVVEQLELYVESRGIEGEAWQRDSVWSIEQTEHDEELSRDFNRQTLGMIDAARRMLIDELEPWLKVTSTRASVGDFVRSLYETITRLGADQTLARWIEAADEETGNAHHEVWTRLMELLDQLVAVLGKESMSFEDFAPLLRAGLAEFSYAIAPSTIDQVIVGSADRTRLGAVKLVVVLGLGDGMFPARHDSTTNLRDDERRALSEQEWDIGPDSRMRLLDELLLAYECFSLPSEMLVAMRPQFDESGRELPASSFWRRLRNVLPEVEPEQVDPGAWGSLASLDQMVRALLVHARSTHGKLAPEFAGLYELIRTDPHLKSSSSRAIESLAYENRAALSHEVINQLYGSNPISGSVSRLETFAACPFKHFARYTLKLDEQSTPALSRIELGSAYHSALERLFERIIEGEHKIDDDLSPVLSGLSQSLASELESRVAIDESRSRFVQAMFGENLNDVLFRQRRTILGGSLRPDRVELSFGLDDHDSGPLTIDTPRGREVTLRGKIDRIDVYRVKSELVASVVDYKLSARLLHWPSAQAGVALQLMTYLLVLTEKGSALLGQPVRAAGALFVGISRLLRSVDRADEICTPDLEDYWKDPKLKPRGLINLDLMNALEANFESQSTFFVGAVPKSGDIRSDIITGDAMQAVLKWTKLKIGELADEIADGNISVHPYRIGTSIPCGSCSYRAVCRFDRFVNKYKEIEGGKPNDIIQRMRSKVGQ